MYFARDGIAERVAQMISAEDRLKIASASSGDSKYGDVLFIGGLSLRIRGQTTNEPEDDDMEVYVWRFIYMYSHVVQALCNHFEGICMKVIPRAKVCPEKACDIASGLVFETK